MILAGVPDGAAFGAFKVAALSEQLGLREALNASVKETYQTLTTPSGAARGSRLGAHVTGI